MATTQHRTILIVDDDNSMREAMERLLSAAGFVTATYASAEALLAGGDIEDALCVISDLKLPAMSGFELLTALRGRVVSPPVILITAHDAPTIRIEAQRRGAAAYLAKPFLGSALLAAIAGLAGVARRV